MNKILMGLAAVFAFLLVIFFFMWRNVSIENHSLTQENSELSTKIEQVQTTLKERDNVITEQNKKYQNLLNSINYNECENLPVSTTLIQAAKELQQ